MTQERYQQVLKVMGEVHEAKNQQHTGANGCLSYPMEKRLLGIEELGQYLGIRPQTIRNRLSAGNFPIPAKKVCGRVKFDRKDIERYLDRLKPHVSGVDSGKPICDTTS
jgi:predicted DNA-binding transcriptional regulator AlpA